MQPTRGGPGRASRRLASLVLVALAAGSACTSSPAEPSDPAPSVAAGAQVVELDGGATLRVPAGAFSAGVEVTATTDGDAPATPDGRTGLAAPVNITAEGEQPKKPVVLEFPYDPAGIPPGMEPRRAMGVSTFNETTKTWEPVDVTFDAKRGVMRAKLDHLSWKWPWEWDWAGIGANINQWAGEQIDKRAPAATCKRGTKIPGWVQLVGANNDSATALRSCAESEDNALVIELVNNRPYGVVMQLDAPVKWTWVEDPDDPAQLVTKLVLSSTLPHDRLYIPPLGRATVALKKGGWRKASLTTDATGATIIGTYLTLALGDVVTKKTATLLVKPLASGCLSGFIKTNADAVVESLGEVHTVVSSTVNCVSEMMLSRALDRTLTPEQQGRAAATYKALGRVDASMKVFSAEWTSLDLYIDKALVPGPSTIPLLAQPPADADVPVELRGTWCSRNGDPCVNFTDLLAENPDAFFDDTYEQDDGSRLYTFCTANDLGDSLGEPACTVAASMYFTYFPAGVAWNCAAVAGDSYDGCDPDFTSDHDLAKPRLVQPLNHQQDRVYVDSPPMYRQ